MKKQEKYFYIEGVLIEFTEYMECRTCKHTAHGIVVTKALTKYGILLADYSVRPFPDGHLIEVKKDNEWVTVSNSYKYVGLSAKYKVLKKDEGFMNIPDGVDEELPEIIL